MYIWRFVFLILLYNATYTMRLKDNQDAQLKQIFENTIKQIQGKFNLKDVSDFDTTTYGEIIGWQPKEKIVNTYLGGLYRFYDKKWECIHKPEYANQKEFFNGIYAYAIAHDSDEDKSDEYKVYFHIKRNSFQGNRCCNYIYNPATRLLMYLMQEEEAYRRHPCVHPNFDTDDIEYPNTIVYERDGNITAKKKLFKKRDKHVVRFIRSDCYNVSSVPHYAFCARNLVQREVDDDEKEEKNEYVIKFLVHGDEPILSYKHKILNDDKLNTFCFKGNNLHFQTVIPDGQGIQHIMSPTHGKSEYTCMLDCGNLIRKPMGIAYYFPDLYKKLCDTKPTIECSDERITLVMEIGEQFGLPIDMVNKIAYDFLHVDEKLRSKIHFVYGSQDSFFPPEDKKACMILGELRNNIATILDKRENLENLSVTHYQLWKARKATLVRDSSISTHYDVVSLWAAAKYGSMHNEYMKQIENLPSFKSSHILLKHLFRQLHFPSSEIKQFPNAKAELVFYSTGKVSLNHSYGQYRRGYYFIRNSFWETFANEMAENGQWTNDAAQQFVKDKAVKDVIFGDTCCTIIFNDATEWRIDMKYLNEERKIDFEVVDYNFMPCHASKNPSALRVGVGYKRAKDDSRTLEQIKDALNKIDDSKLLDMLKAGKK